jgi:putative membrane protein
MKKLSIVGACTILATLAGPALGQSVGERTGVNAAVGVSPSTPDFVKEVAISDMFEIESSKLAAQKSDDATKQFANQMVSDHTKTSTELKSAVQGDADAPLPTALDSSHQSKLDKLKSLTGVDFTKNYHDVQVSAHKDAVSLFERYAKGGDNAKLKSWASSTLPALKHHLEMAQALDK